jgi:hypothetical protein
MQYRPGQSYDRFLESCLPLPEAIEGSKSVELWESSKQITQTIPSWHSGQLRAVSTLPDRHYPEGFNGLIFVVNVFVQQRHSTALGAVILFVHRFKL